MVGRTCEGRSTGTRVARTEGQEQKHHGGGAVWDRGHPNCRAQHLSSGCSLERWDLEKQEEASVHDCL